MTHPATNKSEKRSSHNSKEGLHAKCVCCKQKMFGNKVSEAYAYIGHQTKLNELADKLLTFLTTETVVRSTQSQENVEKNDSSTIV